MVNLALRLHNSKESVRFTDGVLPKGGCVIERFLSFKWNSFRDGVSRTIILEVAVGESAVDTEFGTFDPVSAKLPAVLVFWSAVELDDVLGVNWIVRCVSGVFFQRATSHMVSACAVSALVFCRTLTDFVLLGANRAE